MCQAHNKYDFVSVKLAVRAIVEFINVEGYKCTRKLQNWTESVARAKVRRALESVYKVQDQIQVWKIRIVGVVKLTWLPEGRIVHYALAPDEIACSFPFLSAPSHRQRVKTNLFMDKSPLYSTLLYFTLFDSTSHILYSPRILVEENTQPHFTTLSLCLCLFVSFSSGLDEAISIEGVVMQWNKEKRANSSIILQKDI